MSKKEQIITAATQLFSEKGFDKTSMNEICEAAEVSKGLVYHHFKSKDEILKEIFEQTTEQMMRMTPSNEGATPNERIVALLETFFTQLESDKQLFKLNMNMMFQASTKELLSSLLKQRASGLLDSVTSVFDQMDAGQSRIRSYLFIAELDGIAMDYLNVYEDYPLEEIKQYLITKYKNSK